jgi:hypothetical protein
VLLKENRIVADDVIAQAVLSKKKRWSVRHYLTQRHYYGSETIPVQSGSRPAMLVASGAQVGASRQNSHDG